MHAHLFTDLSESRPAKDVTKERDTIQSGIEAMFKSEDQKGASINTFAEKVEAARTNKSPRIPEVVF
jgi:hypothetical protein